MVSLASLLLTFAVVSRRKRLNYGPWLVAAVVVLMVAGLYAQMLAQLVKQQQR
jgi:hypothetical protein